MAFIIATRKFPIGLLAVVLAALLGAACGSGSTAKPDGGGSDGSSDGGGGDHVTSSNLLVGMIAPGAPSPCITESLQLSGGQAQCTVVQHLSSASGVTNTTLPSCNTASQGPCWSLVTSPSSCPGGGLTFTFDPDPANPDPNPSSLSYDYSCALRSN